MNYSQKKKRDSETPDLFQEPLTSYREDLKAIFDEWNSRIWLPKLIQTDRQCSLIKNALLRPFFRLRWREAINILAKCPFLIYKMKPRFSLDWFCDYDNFDKIIEGKYIEDKTGPTPIPTIHKAVRNGDDEYIT